MGDKEGEGGVKNLKKYMSFMDGPLSSYLFFFGQFSNFQIFLLTLKNKLIGKEWKKVLFSYIYVKSVVLNFRVVTKYSREKTQFDMERTCKIFFSQFSKLQNSIDIEKWIDWDWERKKSLCCDSLCKWLPNSQYNTQKFENKVQLRGKILNFKKKGK